MTEKNNDGPKIKSANETYITNIDLDPSHQPLYPTQMIAITNEDEEGRWVELLKRVERGDENEILAGKESGEELIWSERRPEKSVPLKAVYRIDDEVCQIQYGRGTGPTYAVGRIGVMDIIRNKYKESTGRKISMADLAKIIDSEEPETMEKFLLNLNSGNNVTIATVSRVAGKLGVDPTSLIFYSRLFYKPRAQERNRKEIRKLLDIRLKKAREYLSSYQVELNRISPGQSFGFIEEILSLKVPRSQMDWRGFPTEEQQARAAEALIDVLRTMGRRHPQAIHIIHERIRALEKVGVSVWGGSYEAAEAVVPEDPTVGRSWSHRWVIAFSSTDQTRDRITVDRSNELNLGPDIDD